MLRSIISRALVVASVLGGPLLAGGCGEETSEPSEAKQTGQVAMSLITTVGDNTYRLTAEIDVYGPIYINLVTGDDPDETVLTASLPTGDYGAYLRIWELARQTEDGSFVPVSSNLVSDYYSPFTIHNQSTTTISFQFETDGQIVTVGSGNLVVNIGVTEVPGVCTVLGDDCGDGAWCAPPELTGNTLACIPAGGVAVGEECLSPWECVENSSCFDFGAGPVCGEVCASADFGLPCETGGSCVGVGLEYGVCVPEGGTPPSSGGGSGGEGGGAGGFGGEFAFGGSGG